MKILLVEDEVTFAAEVVAEVEAVIGKGNVDVVTNKDEAFSKIDSSFYDLIVLDLKIPATAESLDTDTTHGHAVFGHCKKSAEGTPICFLTASSTEAFVTRLLNDHSCQGDYWGGNAVETGVRVVQKSHLSEFLEYISLCHAKIQKLHEIEIKFPEGGTLSPETLRVLRAYTKRMGGIACECSTLKGGLSKVKVYKILVENEAGKCINMAVGRIGDSPALQDEVRRFDSIVGSLGVGTFPSRLLSISCGAKSTTGLFYRLADQHGKSLFDFTMNENDIPGTIVNKLKGALKPWKDGSSVKRVTIGELRRCLLKDIDAERLSNEYGVDWVAEIEGINIVVEWGSMHGDLHGGNILVSERFDPVVIDFGDTDEGGTALDPVTLLLSPFFHPDLANKMVDYVSHDQLLDFISTLKASDKYVPTSYFVACVDWISEYCKNSPKTMYACLYVYAFRQLKYPTTDKDLALAIMEIARGKILATIN